LLDPEYLGGADDAPAVHATAPTAIFDELDLTGSEQPAPSSAVGAVRQASCATEFGGGEFVDPAGLIRERCPRREQQARGAARLAVREDLFEQRGVDVAVPPRAERREQDGQRRRVTAATAS
jgi:hypothetical protein